MQRQAHSEFTRKSVSEPAAARHTALLVCLALTLAAMTIAGILVHQWAVTSAHRMHLLPMIGGLDACLLSPEDPTLPDSCRGEDGSASELVTSTLNRLTGRNSPDSGGEKPWPLGYTLKVPLLALLESDASGTWRPDQQAIHRIATTVRKTPRPVLIYLFSTHFGVGGAAEKALAQDIENLSVTADGPLDMDSYYGTPIVPWSIARTNNSVTHAREQVIREVIESLCRETTAVRSRIVGVSLLGEVHHLFPRFETGMGFDAPYRVSDYSAGSVEGFRRHLKKKYSDIAEFNRAMGTAINSFGEIAPPAKDVRRDPQATRLEHLDSFAAGTIPVSGWVHSLRNADTLEKIEIFLNGRMIGLARTGLGRQDVATTHPWLPTANVGWRYDLNVKALPSGIHRIDAFLRTDQVHRVHLGMRRIQLDTGPGDSSQAIEEVALPPSTPQSAELLGYIDHPKEKFNAVLNPLASDWHAFRANQVADYVTHVSRTLDNTCLQNTPRFTHQIMPSGNPSWDSGKFAVEGTLPPPKPMIMGVSLYGESSYGPSFSEWLTGHGDSAYGVTEFHPLRALSPNELRQVLGTHMRQGARFVSFFLEAEHEGRQLNPAQNPFALAPDNEKYGSNIIYRSLHNLLKP